MLDMYLCIPSVFRINFSSIIIIIIYILLFLTLLPGLLLRKNKIILKIHPDLNSGDSYESNKGSED